MRFQDTVRARRREAVRRHTLPGIAPERRVAQELHSNGSTACIDPLEHGSEGHASAVASYACGSDLALLSREEAGVRSNAADRKVGTQATTGPERTRGESTQVIDPTSGAPARNDPPEADAASFPLDRWLGRLFRLVGTIVAASLWLLAAEAVFITFVR